MNKTNNKTLERIQREIKEDLEREEELKKLYSYNGNHKPENHKSPPEHKSNGYAATPKLFQKKSSTKGVMQKFYKMGGKIGMVSIRQPVQNNSIEDFCSPPKVLVEKGIPVRKNFISAEEKMRKELQEFQEREQELRKERFKSQPDIMMALNQESLSEENGTSRSPSPVLQRGKSMDMLYEPNDNNNNRNGDYIDVNNGKMRPASSLAALCAVGSEELETPGTMSLILQFESLKTQQART